MSNVKTFCYKKKTPVLGVATKHIRLDVSSVKKILGENYKTYIQSKDEANSLLA